MKVTLLEILDKKEGVSSKGNAWINVDFLVNTGAQYDPNVAFNAFGKTAEEIFELPIGSTFDIEYNLKSREYNGKYYTNAQVWSVKNVEKPSQGSVVNTPPSKGTIIAGQDGLPF